MSKMITYGIGGYCENCDSSHDHPLHNLIEEIDIPDILKASLDFNGIFATLNAVLGVWTLEDAANAAKLTPEDLIAEAEAWAAARDLNNPL